MQVIQRNLQDLITSSTIIYAYAEIGTVATRAAPMKTYGNHNYSTTKTNY
jgi:hypothetical protein